MKKVVFVGASKAFVPVSEILEKEKKAEIVHWFFKEPKYDKELEIAKNTTIQNYPSPITYNKIFEELPVFLNTFIRMRSAKGKTYYEYINIFNIFVNYVYNILIKQKIDKIFFTNIPHNGIDYLVYVIAKNLNIPTILFYNNPLFADHFFYIYDINDFGYFNDIKPNLSVKYIHVPKSFKKDSVVKKAHNVNKRRYNCLRILLQNIFKMCIGHRHYVSFSNILEEFERCKTYKKFYKQAVDNVDMTKPYVFFALHLQPELHTSTLGGIYNDQVLAIEHLSQIIPKDWMIYVKDHPQQIFFQRDEYFFKRLKQVPNVVYLSDVANTYNLMQSAQLVSTITGTAGWEAITGGKKVLIFGKSWYRSLPGVFEFKSDINFEQIMAYEIDHNELEEKYNLLREKLREGTTNSDYNNFVDSFDDLLNAKKICTCIEEELM